MPICRAAVFRSSQSYVLHGNHQCNNNLQVPASGGSICTRAKGVVGNLLYVGAPLLHRHVFAFLSLGLACQRQALRCDREGNCRDLLCDADLLLDNDLHVIGSTAKLSHLLLHTRPNQQDLDNELFSYLLAEDDQPRFLNFIKASSEDVNQEVAPPTSLQVNMKDALGKHIHVRLFHVELPNSWEPHKPRHLLGLRQESDIAVPDNDIEDSTHHDALRGEIPLMEDAYHAEDVDVGKPSRQNRRGPLSSASSSASSGSGGGRHEQPLPQIASIDVVVQIDQDGKLPIESASIKFCLSAVKGLVANDVPDLHKWMLGPPPCKRGMTLSAWLQSEVNSMQYADESENDGGDPSESEKQKGNFVKLRSLGMDGRTRMVSYEVSVDIPELDEEEEDPEDDNIKVLLTFRQLWEYRRSTPRFATAEHLQPMPTINEGGSPGLHGLLGLCG